MTHGRQAFGCRCRCRSTSLGQKKPRKESHTYRRLLHPPPTKPSEIFQEIISQSKAVNHGSKVFKGSFKLVIQAKDIRPSNNSDWLNTHNHTRPQFNLTSHGCKSMLNRFSQLKKKTYPGINLFIPGICALLSGDTSGGTLSYSACTESHEAGGAIACEHRHGWFRWVAC